MSPAPREETGSSAVRAKLVDALRLDLIGPVPGGPHQDEELPQAPSRWYVGGFLVPFEAPEEQRRDPTSGEQLELGAEGGGNGGSGGGGGGDDDDVPEKASARKAYFPSSIGLSVLVPEEASSLEAEVTWGDYRMVGEEAPATPGSRAVTWKRTPRREVVTLSLPAETGKPVAVQVPGSGGLRLVTSVRRAARAGAEMGLAEGTRAVSVFLVNHRDAAAEERKDEAMAFQARLVLRSAQPFVPRPDVRGLIDGEWDEQVADLQYRDVAEHAVGHGVAAHAVPGAGGEGAKATEVTEVATEWLPAAEVEKVEPASVPGVELGMEALAAFETPKALQEALQGFPERYRAWIEQQRKTPLSGKRAEAAKLLLDDARTVCGRIEKGIDLLADPDVFKAFRTANRAMANAGRQRRAQEAPSWFPFQLAFLLMNLRSVADRACRDRDTVDLLFFPTGGGKTEAYLGLAAFSIVLRRLRNPGLSSAGVTVLMRYTLRLLTLDQLSRAAALVCALELEREADPAALGPWPFEIGLWVGKAATPNRMGRKGDKNAEGTARQKVLGYRKDSKRPIPIPLETCPWCGTRFKPTSFALLPNADSPTDLRVVCASQKCAFRGDRALPILTVDEPIYRRLPCFLIATVDKFASLPWVGEAGALLGKADRADAHGFYGPAAPAGRGSPLGKPLLPPDLIIQDELHLISGPLGTIAGLYEAAIDTLATRVEDGRTVRPKVIASTATVRRAQTQIRALFGRTDVVVFPPPGPDRRDSFFAVTVPKEKKAPRLYLGLSAQGRSPKVLLLRSYLALLGAAARLHEEAGGAAAGPGNPADPYMTLVGYFNALRELGGSRRIVEDEVAARLSAYGERKRIGEAEGLFLDRAIQHEVVELTSRESTARVARAKERLALPFSHPERVDVALATNMISVGLDIARLGLMVVLGQPKAAAEYIQATSRVGRDDRRPGLVLTLLNLHRPRDRSHFERFEAFHAAFYRAVEATSVTPFAPRALDRALAAVAVSLARHGVADLTSSGNALGMRGQKERTAANVVAERLSDWSARHDSRRTQEEIDRLRAKVRSLVDDVLDSWSKIARDHAAVGTGLAYARREKPGEKGTPPLLWDPLDPELESQPREARKFRANRSMRDVEPTVGLWVRRLDGADAADDDANDTSDEAGR